MSMCSRTTVTAFQPLQSLYLICADVLQLLYRLRSYFNTKLYTLCARKTARTTVSTETRQLQ
jgi:hypothetical protein